MYQNGFLNVQRQVSILRTICLAIAPRLKLTFPVSYLEGVRPVNFLNALMNEARDLNPTPCEMASMVRLP